MPRASSARPISQRQNAELRAEAIAILKRIDEHRAAAAGREAGTAAEPDRESAGDSV